MSHTQFTTLQDRPMSLIPVTPTDHQMTLAGQAADYYAALGTFPDYLSRKADNTIIRQYGDLTRFADYLNAVGDQLGAGLAAFATDVRTWVSDRQGSTDFQTNPDPEVWRGISWGMVEGFRNWMVSQGDAVGSINVRLSTVKTYAKKATKAGVLTHEQLSAIRLVEGYAHKEIKRVNERREVTRRGDKKAEHVSLTKAQAKQLKTQPDTPQGRRDAVMMCILLDMGLRCGELALIQVSDFDLTAGELRFYRPKVDKVQTHKLSPHTKRALKAYFEHDAITAGPLLRGSVKGGALTDAGMTERAITKRVCELGIAVGKYEEHERVTESGKVKTVKQGTLSAHDCRHYWATYWADKVDLFTFQEAGGWNSLAMPRRYVEEKKIANEGFYDDETDE